VFVYIWGTDRGGLDGASLRCTCGCLHGGRRLIESLEEGANITLSDRRCHMGDDVLEAAECLKSWQRDGVIVATKEDVKSD